MNTFLPYPDYKKCAQVLDDKRLNKQITECLQIFNIVLRKTGLLNDGKKGWLNHPVLNLWSTADGKIYAYHLLKYNDAMTEEWCKVRNHNHVWNERRFYYLDMLNANRRKFGKETAEIKWSKKFHEIMKLNLLRKNLDHYSKSFDPSILDKYPDQIGYIWEPCKVKV